MINGQVRIKYLHFAKLQSPGIPIEVGGLRECDVECLSYSILDCHGGESPQRQDAGATGRTCTERG